MESAKERMRKNRKDFELSKRMCLGKTKHASENAAKYILGQISFRGKESHLLSVYQCKFCKKFHIGHDRKIPINLKKTDNMS